MPPASDNRPKAKGRLVKPYTHYDTTSISDLLALAAYNVEEGLLTAGAIANVDYTLLDVFKLVASIYGKDLRTKEFVVPNALDIKTYAKDQSTPATGP